MSLVVIARLLLLLAVLVGAKLVTSVVHVGFGLTAAVVVLAAVAWDPRRRVRFGLVPDRWCKEVLLGIGSSIVLSGILLGLVRLYWGAEGLAVIWHRIVDQSLSGRLGFLAIGITAAIIEELLFRGWLQPAFVRKLGLTAGVISVALLFVACHPDVYRWPPYRALNLLVIGLSYGVLRGRDRPLIACLVAHTLAWTIWGGT